MDPSIFPTILQILQGVMGKLGGDDGAPGGTGGSTVRTPGMSPAAQHGAMPAGLPDIGGGLTSNTTVTQALSRNRSKINDAFAKVNNPAGEGVAKSDPITDPGAGSGGNDVITGPNPGQPPYGNQFQNPNGGPNYDELFPDDQSLVDTYGWGALGGGGGGNGGGGGMPLSWLEKLGLGSSIGGQVSGMMPKAPSSGGLPGGGGYTKIDPVSVQFMLRNRRGY